MMPWLAGADLSQAQRTRLWALMGSRDSRDLGRAAEMEMLFQYPRETRKFGPTPRTGEAPGTE